MFLPPKLADKDLIVLVAPSGKTDLATLEKAQQFLDKAGFKSQCGKHVLRQEYGLAGTDDQRLEDLHWAIEHPEAKAIWCLRGGYGLSRIVDRIDFKGLLEKPKWVIGFSDITALHLAINKLHFPTLHGIMPVKFLHPLAMDYLNTLQLLRKGHLINAFPMFDGPAEDCEVHAPVVGGNLAMVCDSLGTPCEIKTKGRILFLEDVDEAPHRIDRMLNQLKRAGKLDGVKALLTGDFTNCEEENPSYPKNYYKSQLKIMAKDLGFPYFPDLPMGHGEHNYPLVLGAPILLLYQNGLLRIEQLPFNREKNVN